VVVTETGTEGVTSGALPIFAEAVFDTQDPQQFVEVLKMLIDAIWDKRKDAMAHFRERRRWLNFLVRRDPAYTQNRYRIGLEPLHFFPDTHLLFVHERLMAMVKEYEREHTTPEEDTPAAEEAIS
jgi:hypothetical protein